MRSPVQDYLQTIADQCGGTAGEVAGYIPELAAADPDRFGLCLATVDGHVYEVGDTRDLYSIQSISKPFTYALALADQGREAVAAKVGVEPSGEAFNEISVAPDTGRPRNPMINAGAITSASLVAGATGPERFDRVLDWYGAFAGRELTVDESIYGSELRTAHRNRAIAHMLRELEILEGDPEESLDQYVRQCSVSVTTRDLSLMAATLANGGLHPVTGERVLETGLVEHVLSVMTTCGMYDAAGDWVTAVGMPAKSGVSGGIIAVLPGQVGVAVFSPRLDAHGNSARGVQLCERMSTDMEMHLMHVGRSARTAVRTSYSLADARTRRRRSTEEVRVLDGVEDRCRVYELHGDLLFAGAESVVRSVIADEPELAVLDVRRVDEVASVAQVTLLALRDRLRDAGAEGVLVDPEGNLTDPDADTERATRVFPDLEAATAWCEDELLRRHGTPSDYVDRRAEDHPLLGDLAPATRELVRGLMRTVHVPAGQVVLPSGGSFAGVHVITKGQAVARVDAPDGGRLTLVTMGPGTSFGELALGTHDVQESEISAETDLELLVLTAADLEQVALDDPVAGVDVWRAMTRDAYRVAERAMRRGAVRSRGDRSG